MDMLLAIFAFLLAGTGCVLAWRARRASLRLALEMIEMRDRLAEAEQGRAAAEATMKEMDAVSRTKDQAADPSLLPRLIDLEYSVRDALSARPSPGRTPGDDPRVHVRTQLEQRGFERVSILGAAEDGRYLVEAVRRGVVSKGHAEIAPDGVVHWHSLSSLRAFP
jgi:hypothetical protein